LGRKLNPARVHDVVIATAEKGGHYYRLGCLLKDEMNKNGNLHLEARISGGTLDNIQLVRSGKADFAFIQGALQEGGKADLSQLCGVATIGRQFVHIIAPRNSSVRHFKDLQGKTVSLGPALSGNDALGRLVFRYLQPYAGITLINSDINSLDDDFSRGKMDAVFTVYDLHAPILENLMDQGKYRLVSIPEAEAVAYTIPGCTAAQLPHSLYGADRNIPAADQGTFYTVKVQTLLITHKNTKPVVVRQLLNTLYSARFIKKSRLYGLDEDSGRQVFDLPLHPEADNFYRRRDPVTSDKYEIGSAFLAALMFIAGVFGFLHNRYKARQLEKKKKRIIPYFEELLKYSRSMSVTDDIDKLKELLDRMMAMQRRAEMQWLEGDLDTEHMENLYAIYGIRCSNVFHKMNLMQLKRLKDAHTGKENPAQ